MNVEEALEIIENVLAQGHLNKVQETVFRQCWEGLSYSEIASSSGYEVGYIRDVGFKLWQSLSHVFEKKVTKNNFHGVLKQQYLAMHGMRSRSAHTEELRIQASVPNLLTAKAITADRCQDWAEAVDVSMFYGYPAELDTLKQ